MLQLYHWEPNANSGKPMLALAEKGVAYESHYLDLLKFDQHQPDYLRINPDGTIPAMVHGSTAQPRFSGRPVKVLLSAGHLEVER